ncbi:hypothetical protein [Ensifer adhaerens]|uniref:hypothetical protein n=1 Tax=Ensifer adhaerens TaxID=106592 RepID=UPI000CF051C8|nr:hypothetical protein [Ensifer adhaerens]
MVNIASLRPSDIERLSGGPLSPEDKNSILSSLQTMLSEIQSDGGADSDRIYMAAQMLDMANVWDQIPKEDLAKAVSDAPELAIKDLLEGLPHDYAREVSYLILTEEKPRPRLKDDAYWLSHFYGGDTHESEQELPLIYTKGRSRLLQLMKRYAGNRPVRDLGGSEPRVAIIPVGPKAKLWAGGGLGWYLSSDDEDHGYDFPWKEHTIDR